MTEKNKARMAKKILALFEADGLDPMEGLHCLALVIAAVVAVRTTVPKERRAIVTALANLIMVQVDER